MTILCRNIELKPTFCKQRLSEITKAAGTSAMRLYFDESAHGLLRGKVSEAFYLIRQSDEHTKKVLLIFLPFFFFIFTYC